MGTRHLTAVIIDGQHKIAQYGQWDGYPSGQGSTILAFLGSTDIAAFGEKVRRCRFITEEERRANWIELGVDVEKNGGFVDWDVAKQHSERWPELSRDTGAGILELVSNSEAGLGLVDSYPFAANSLFCEFAYVVDLDTRKLEAYSGFNKEPVPEGERFANMPRHEENGKPSEYYPVRFVAAWPLDALPAVEEMAKAFGDEENEE